MVETSMEIRRVLAANPGPYTGPGTNTWILVSGSAAVIIDPGPVDATHAESIISELGEAVPRAVLVTHTHSDHAPLANPLARDLGVPAVGHQPGPEFDPDEQLVEGSVLSVGDVDLSVIHTPGHSEDHLCFLAGKVLFTGDHIMGGGSVMIEDLIAYLHSLEKIRPLDLSALYPGHGEVMDRPYDVIDWYVAHRLQREEEIISAIDAGADTLALIVEEVYSSVDPSLHPLASRSVRAHLAKLESEGLFTTVTNGSELKVRRMPPSQGKPDR